jgi:hypothetical protein
MGSLYGVPSVERGNDAHLRRISGNGGGVINGNSGTTPGTYTVTVTGT